jgi:hypothetical protein
MKNLLIIGSCAAVLMASTAVTRADQSIDRTMTFTIPAHAIQSYVSTLTEKSDFSVFVDKECPAELQQLALRRLWKILPTEKTDSPFS